MPRTPEFGADQVGPIDEIQFGLQANRPINPLKSWVYIATDTKKFWACFTDNVWTHVNPVDLSGASEGQYFRYDGATGFLVPATGVTGVQTGLDENKAVDPDVGDIYMATDTEIVYYCFNDDEWTPTYLPRTQLLDFEKDDNDDIQPVRLDAIFVEDGDSDLMPSIDGEEDPEFEIVSGEITPKALV
jgi:hypothetical protein